MTAQEERDQLDALIRQVQHGIAGSWPVEGGERQEGVTPSSALAAALALAVQANDSGIAADITTAREALQAAWAPPSPASLPSAADMGETDDGA